MQHKFQAFSLTHPETLHSAAVYQENIVTTSNIITFGLIGFYASSLIALAGVVSLIQSLS